VPRLSASTELAEARNLRPWHAIKSHGEGPAATGFKKIAKSEAEFSEFLDSDLKLCRSRSWVRKEGADQSGLSMRALCISISAVLVSAALSGCITCRIPLNAPPYDPTQWGWGPQERFCVTRSYYGFAKDYPGVRPYRLVPPGAPPYMNPGSPGCFSPAGPPCGACGPTYGPNGMPMWSAQTPMVSSPVAVNPTGMNPNAVAF
jgi:hypothetical protein